MQNEEQINTLINEKYNLVKGLASTNKFNDELVNMLTLIYVGNILQSGNRVDLAFFDIIRTLPIIYEDMPMKEILTQMGYPNPSDGTAALTIFQPNFEVFKKSDLKQKKPIIAACSYFGNARASQIVILECLAHELFHALTGYQNTNYLVDNLTYYMRTGLSENYYKVSDINSLDNIKLTNKYNTFNEIYTTFFTQCLINIILGLKAYKISNPNINSYIRRLVTHNADKIYRSIAYKEFVQLNRPFLISNELNDIILKVMYNGRIESFISYFNSITSNEITFLDLSTRLDNIFNDYREVVGDNCSQTQKEDYINKLEEYKTMVKKFYYVYNGESLLQKK